MIGLSDGSQYDSAFDLYLGSNSYHKELTPYQSLIPVDQDHHVPLAASAVMDDQGKMVGLAVDHRVPYNPEYFQHVALHEAAELPHMQNLITAGRSPTDAYHEAHDKIATPTETAAVRAYAARSGQDPDQYLERYKQFWRDAASVAAEPTDKPRHPDAHTTRYGLDEGEGIQVTEGGPRDLDPANDNIQSDAPTPEMTAHDQQLKAEEPPMVAIRQLGSHIGRPVVMPAANQNKKLQLDPPELDTSTGPFENKSVKEWQETHPDLVKYAKELEAQERRAKLKLVEKPRSVYQDLKDWFMPRETYGEYLDRLNQENSGDEEHRHSYDDYLRKLDEENAGPDE